MMRLCEEKSQIDLGREAGERQIIAKALYRTIEEYEFIKIKWKLENELLCRNGVPSVL
jgi:hypothetical protein